MALFTTRNVHRIRIAGGIVAAAVLINLKPFAAPQKSIVFTSEDYFAVRDPWIGGMFCMCNSCEPIRISGKPIVTAYHPDRREFGGPLIPSLKYANNEFARAMSGNTQSSIAANHGQKSVEVPNADGMQILKVTGTLDRK
jgi:hypothetical protein